MRIDQLRIQVAYALFEPFLERRPGLEDVMDVIVLKQHTIDEVDSEHFTGSEATFADDVLLFVVVDTDLRRYRDMPVLRDDVASGPQAVPVETTGRVTPVRENDARGNQILEAAAP